MKEGIFALVVVATSKEAEEDDEEELTIWSFSMHEENRRKRRNIPLANTTMDKTFALPIKNTSLD